MAVMVSRPRDGQTPGRLGLDTLVTPPGGSIQEAVPRRTVHTADDMTACGVPPTFRMGTVTQ